ncbi:hypothetical protein A9G13_05455 [Gilliamella sp. wkB178]|uniref:hypothetical protein n=1 Tax=Gilliamella sp. wkB178 TaxID=3120259 RepID=UPI00080D8D78|nr:hypothetical protein [Gilliamella apicola]OCG07665.1 hypothetical protein A9G13_05455 [Gilliamella apicola]
MKLLLVMVLLLIFNGLYINTGLGLVRDPFTPFYQMSCDEQATNLLKQIQVWQFKGLIKNSDASYEQLWLFSDNQWLAITAGVIPNVLFPWQIQTLFTDKIVWHANLADSCEESVLWTMPLNK